MYSTGRRSDIVIFSSDQSYKLYYLLDILVNKYKYNMLSSVILIKEIFQKWKNSVVTIAINIQADCVWSL